MINVSKENMTICGTETEICAETMLLLLRYVYVGLNDKKIPLEKMSNSVRSILSGCIVGCDKISMPDEWKDSVASVRAVLGMAYIDAASDVVEILKKIAPQAENKKEGAGAFDANEIDNSKNIVSEILRRMSEE